MSRLAVIVSCGGYSYSVARRLRLNQSSEKLMINTRYITLEGGSPTL